MKKLLCKFARNLEKNLLFYEFLKRVKKRLKKNFKYNKEEVLN